MTTRVGFFVTIMRGTDARILAGPFATHDAALDRVDEARKICIDLYPRTIFDGFGTAKTETTSEKMPVGGFNRQMLILPMTTEKA